MALSSVVYALCLVFLATADGRVASSSNASSLVSTSSTTTSSYDVNGLIILINQFPQLSGANFPLYTKDPCYPQMLSWITCSYDNVRRITALYLENQILYGYLPDFSSMDALQKIELQGNFLSGSIPEFLGNFPELTYLNLADNYFTGALPYSLVNNKRITLIIAGNSGLCSSSYSCSPPSAYSPPFSSGGDFDLPDMPKTKKSKFRLKFLYGLIPACLIAVLGTVCVCCRRKRKGPAPAAGGAAS